MSRGPHLKSQEKTGQHGELPVTVSPEEHRVWGVCL